MARNRFWLKFSLSVVAALVVVQIGRSQEPRAQVVGTLGNGLVGASIGSGADRAATSPSCKVYSLAELGDDPKLCKWIAETIPEMIQPASWKQRDAKLSYYAPSKILVINNTPTVHAQVDDFLQNLRKTLPQKAAARIDSQVMPAQFPLQDSSRPVGSVQTGPASYPVPMSPVGPKHLFHFIIRYEGEGIIDANVAKFAKALSEQAVSNNSGYLCPQQSPVCPTNICPAPPATCIPAPPPPAFSSATGLQPTNGTNAPANVQPMPPAETPKPPAAPAVPAGSWKVADGLTAPAAAAANIAEQLKERGVAFQKLYAMPDGVRLTCYLPQEGGGRFRILETTAKDYTAAVRAVVEQIDGKRPVD